MSYQNERDEFIAAWVRNGGTLRHAQRVMRDAISIERQAIADCNGVPRYPTSDARTYNAQRRITNICKESGFSVRFGGDPRGYCVKIAFPDGSFNTWGGREEGWGVPVRLR